MNLTKFPTSWENLVQLIPWDKWTLFTHNQDWNFKWLTPVKIAGNNKNMKRFLYSKPYFDGLRKILAVFDG